MLSAASSVADKQSVRFNIIRGLADAQGISFESVDQPGFFLSDAASQLQLIANDQSVEFAKKATFYPRAYSSDAGASYFESMNSPGTFIARQNSVLVLSSSVGSADALWNVQKNGKTLSLHNLPRLQVDGSASFAESFDGAGALTPRFTVADQLSMKDNHLIANALNVSLAKNHTFNNIELKNFSALTTPSGTGVGFVLIANNVTIDEGSKIDLSKKAFSSGGSSLAGGSHGGRGGSNGANTSPNTYGSSQQPVTLADLGPYGALGGGAFKLTAQSLNLNGEILANGDAAGNNIGAAAGGSIWLVIENIISSSGKGKIRADGGKATGSSASAGGGGRIAIYGALTGIEESNISVKGGAQGNTPSQPGQDGTIHKNLGSVPPYVTSISVSGVTNQPVQSLRLVFSAPMLSSSFATNDILVTDSNQNNFIPSAVAALSNTEYEVSFSPALADGNYTIKVGPEVLGHNGLKLDQNKNLIPGEAGDVYTYSFAVDTAAPSATVLNTYPLVTGNSSYTFVGTKEAGSQVLVNGYVLINANSATTWSYTFHLTAGNNTYNFVVKDVAGNSSVPTVASIIYDNVAPGPVNAHVTGNGDGTQLTVDWSSYNEVANGDDIFQYRIYLSSSNYSSISQLTPVKTVNRLTKYTVLSGLNQGQQYYVSVVALDYSDKFESSVTPVMAVPVDTKAPSGMGNLQVTSALNNLLLSWIPAVDSDLAAYRVSYFENNAPKTIVLSKAEVGTANPVTYQLTNLLPATAHNIVITAVDDNGNTSAALTDPGVTLINNPFDLKVDSGDAKAFLSWSSIQPNALIKHYAVYVQNTPFSSVEGLTPVKTVYKGSSAQTSVTNQLLGLTNGNKVYVAVTTVNNSNGEIKSVQPIAVTPQSDMEGPIVTEAKYISGSTSFNLDNNPTLTAAGRVSIKATDLNKVNRIAYSLDGEPLGTVLATNYLGAYEQSLNLLELTDGVHNLTVDAYDNVQNLTQKNYTFVVDYASPSAPSINSPAANLVTNQASITLIGSAPVGTNIVLSNNGSALPPVATDDNGKFSAVVDLQEGANQFIAKAQYIGRAKWSVNSASRTFSLNTQVPSAPSGLTAVATKQGQILLNWNAIFSDDPNNQAKGYNVYRSTSDFSSINANGVQKVNTKLLTTNSFSDLLVTDGKYFYAVSAVNPGGNESSLSATASAVSDNQNPKIVQLVFTTDGAIDPATGRIGKGAVKVSATFNEALRNNPYFAVVPHQGVPLTVQLSKSYGDEKLYTGQFQITETTPAGVAYAVMSAYDNVGNRGTDIEQNATLKIDTQGPEVTQLTISPIEPLKVDEVNGLAVNVAIKLNDDTNQNQMPKLVPLLDGVFVAGYNQGITLTRDSNSMAGEPVWSGTFSLPNTAAKTAKANLSFTYWAEDDLHNSTVKINGKNQFQVYQGELPPLSIPNNLTALAQPNGKVKLNWQVVEDAVSYVLYRQGPTDSSMVAMAPMVDTAFIDETAIDGTYVYAIASVRSENGQESRSAKSASVSVKSDRVAPAAPQNFALELNGAGLVSRWIAPTVDVQGAAQIPNELTYNLYRVNRPQGQQVPSTAGITPLQTRIPALIALDTKPSVIEHSYFVTAVDAAGNESAPSITEYLNFGLLPVNQLHIVLNDSGYPALTWQHNGEGVDHYRISRRTGNEPPVLLTPEGIEHTASPKVYTDTSYNENKVSKGASQEVIYSIVAVDSNNVASIAHELKLPAVSARIEKTKEVAMERGVMNQVMFRVDNNGRTDAKKLRLYVSLIEDGVTRAHQSEYFDVSAGANTLVPVIIGGYSKLNSLADLTLRLEQIPESNESVKITQLETVEVGTSSLTVNLNTEEFTRGGVGKASFTLTNTSDVETEVVLANSSTTSSSEVRLVLEDLQGNVLSQLPIKQATGGGIAVGNGKIVARISPKESFTSGQFNINIPFASPDQVKLRLVIDKYHYHSGRATHVEIAGAGTSKEVQLSDTPYYVEIDSITPSIVYAKGDTIAITGRVKERGTGNPMVNVPINIIYNVRGFELKSTAYSDNFGNFVYLYKSDGSPGKYRISAVHPDVTDRPNHGEFIVEGGTISPSDIDLKVPRNYEQKIPVKIGAGFESTLRNVRLVLLPSGTNETAQLPTGISIGSDLVAMVNANSSAYLNITFSGNNTASDTGLISYRVEADNHTGAKALGTLNIRYSLMQAAPAVTTKPSYLDSGVGLDKEVIEDLVITNKGLDILRNASLELSMKNGSAAPAWIRLNTSTSLGDLAIGEERAVQLIANPPAGTAEGDYEFKLKVVGDNLNPYSIPVLIKVTQSGIGKAFFHVSDLYTATLNESAQLIEGVNKTTIRLQNENVLSQVFTLNTDVKGEALFDNIPAGRYSYRASAFDHDSVSGRIWVKPGITSSEEVFLTNVLVNVEWSVREITIEDRYEVKLEATFKTNVPAPLLMMSPLMVRLPVMKQGEVFQGELTLTNHGLIRAQNVKQVLPTTSKLAKFEFLKPVPSSLEAGEVFVMPYRVQALSDFNPEADAQATGGGCGNFTASTSVTSLTACSQGSMVPNSASANFDANWGSCGSSNPTGYVTHTYTGPTQGSISPGWGHGPPDFGGNGTSNNTSACKSKDPNNEDECDGGPQ